MCMILKHMTTALLWLNGPFDIHTTSELQLQLLEDMLAYLLKDTVNRE